MKKLNSIMPIALLGVVALLVSCASVPVPVASGSGAPETDTFYFAFDRSDVNPSDFPTLDQHAEAIQRRIARDSDLRVNIEGHADERGSEAYNEALGNRRAEAVSRYLRVRGVPAGNLFTTSYGELRPVDSASSEAAWAKNRRSVILSY